MGDVLWLADVHRARLTGLGPFARPHLLDIGDCVRRLAGSIAVVDVDRADGLGRDSGLFCEGLAASANGDHGHIHRFFFAIGSFVDDADDLVEVGLKEAVREVGIVVGEMCEQDPSCASDVLIGGPGPLRQLAEAVWTLGDYVRDNSVNDGVIGKFTYPGIELLR